MKVNFMPVTYGKFIESEFVSVLTQDQPSKVESYAAELFRSMVKHPHFPCLGAHGAVSRNLFRLGVYESESVTENAQQIINALSFFEEERNEESSVFATYVAIFLNWEPTNEIEFESSLWKQLKSINNIDCMLGNKWDESVSDDPNNPNFGFSINGKAYFVIGMHPCSSRWSRRFIWPALVFNAHTQFSNLREEGKFDSMKKKIRKRDMKIQNSYNPMMVGSKEISEAKQYSGRDHSDAEWSCPFTNLINRGSNE